MVEKVKLKETECYLKRTVACNIRKSLSYCIVLSNNSIRLRVVSFNSDSLHGLISAVNLNISLEKVRKFYTASSSSDVVVRPRVGSPEKELLIDVFTTSKRGHTV